MEELKHYSELNQRLDEELIVKDSHMTPRYN